MIYLHICSYGDAIPPRREWLGFPCGGFMNKLEEYSKKFMKKNIPLFQIGDTVDVVVKIKADVVTKVKGEKPKTDAEKAEANKERRQIFNGIVIAMHGYGLNKTFIVRRIVQGEGVERTFPIHSPRLITVNIKKRGKSRRAKLFYLRDRVGKSTKLKEKIWLAKDAKELAEISSAAEEEMK